MHALPRIGLTKLEIIHFPHDSRIFKSIASFRNLVELSLTFADDSIFLISEFLEGISKLPKLESLSVGKNSPKNQRLEKYPIVQYFRKEEIIELIGALPTLRRLALGKTIGPN